MSFASTILSLKAGGKILVVGLEDQILIYDISSMKLAYTIVITCACELDFAYSPECSYIANTCDEIGYLNVFNVEKLELQCRIKAHKSKIRNVRFSGTGRYLASASEKVTFVY